VKARGPAFAARDAFDALEDDPAHPEYAAAQAAGFAMWEACQTVAP
jgi:hypothetical protein